MGNPREYDLDRIGRFDPMKDHATVNLFLEKSRFFVKLANKRTLQPAARRRIKIRFLMLAAVVLHISVAASVSTVGRLKLMPGQFHESGLGVFAPDSFDYQVEVMDLCDVLMNQGVKAWATWPTQLHVRLYSLPVAMFYPGTGFNILVVEPLNLIYYLAILVLVFKLGESVFDHRAGLVGAAIVAVWPSFLMHTTQLLRDPLLICAVLLLMLSITKCLKHNYGWYRGVLIGITAAAAIVVIRIVRLPMWYLVCAIVGVATVFLLARFVRQRRWPIGNICLILIVIAAVVITPRFRFLNQQTPKTQQVIRYAELVKLPLREQLERRREAFQLQLDDSGKLVPSQAGSDIDSEVRFDSFTNIVRHLPRAAVVGFFAPFPGMWLSAGKQVSLGGRVLSGLEMLLTYVIECLALVGLWRGRKQLVAWFLFSVAAMGIMSLGLIVNNVGALYRLRYSFWILLVILATAGLVQLLGRTSVAAGSPSSGAAEPFHPGTSPVA